MKDLTKFEVTMTSLEIAEYTDKRHDNILADINTMLIGLHGITGHLLFQDTYVTKGKSYKCYRLPKKEVICLISGYSVKLRMAIINRLEELEGKAPTAPKINAPTTTEQLKEDITMLEMFLVQHQKKLICLKKVSLLSMVCQLTCFWSRLNQRKKMLPLQVWPLNCLKRSMQILVFERSISVW